MHATRFNRLSMVGRARFLHKAGYSVLLFDFQSHGESEGDLVTFGDQERDDARTAVKFMVQRHPSAPIGIIGFSLGGTAAVLNGPSLGADALVIEAVLSTLEQAVINRIHQRVGPLAPLLAHPLLLSFQVRYGINPQSIRPIDFIHTLGIPVFVIGGTHDEHTLPSETQALYSKAHSPKKLWFVQGAHHQDFHQYAPTDYETRVLPFLNAHIGCTP
ncbi:MAG: hypothetical protein NPIRA04_21400 [Nitrospirales bacterium]|nr:MAG: hypothetical protein NPIRA04_21400 [Nitrospirales bacterium]